MGSSVDVNSTSFATEVVEKSYEKPVVVDFFATWCGPCQLLKPILEALQQEYDFVLAKIDIDRDPELASTYGVEGVPDVKIVKGGQIVDGFVGVKPEPEIRQMLIKLNLKSDLDEGIEAMYKAIASGNPKEAKQICDRLFSKYPDNPRLTLEAAKFLIAIDQPEDAEKLLATITRDRREYFPQAQAVKALILFQQAANNPGESELDRQYADACRLALAKDYEAALPLFLDIVSTNRKYRDDGARKAMLAIFDLLGGNRPLTKEYRKQLQMALYWAKRIV